MVTPQLFAHPFSSYSWKAQIALAEKGIAYDYRIIDGEHPDNVADWAQRWPMKQFPVLALGDRTIVEATAIVEWLEVEHGATLIPADPAAAVEVRMMDRIFDLHVMAQMQRIVNDALRPEERRDAIEVAQARAKLDAVYAWLETRIPAAGWVCGNAFTLADCAAAPSLFYADWAHPMDGRFPGLAAYRARLLTRPSVAKAVDGGRPYRAFFPLGAPDRD